LQAAFPGVKGFSARNLWFMKQWYSFYTTDLGNASLLAKLGDEIDAGSKKLKQVASEIVKVNQAASEFPFPTAPNCFRLCPMDASCAHHAEVPYKESSSATLYKSSYGTNDKCKTGGMMIRTL
jgi:hypothetical protein